MGKMKGNKTWLLVIAAAVGSGIFCGVLLFLFYNNTDSTGENRQHLRATEMQTETEQNTDWTESEPETQQRLEKETEDFSGYFGTYVPKNGADLIVDLDENEETVSRPRQISAGALLYIEDVKRGGEELLGYTEYFGLHFWVPLGELEKISENDYSIKVGDEGVVCETWAGVALSEQPQAESTVFALLDVGTVLPIIQEEDGYIQTYTPEYGYGWVSGNYVTVFSTEFPYRMLYDEGESSEEIPFYYNFPENSGVIIEDAAGSISAGSVLWFENFSGCWGYTILEGNGVWMDMTNALPVRQLQSQELISYQLYEKEPEGRTDFYDDETPVTANQFILPEAQSGYLTQEDIEGLTLKGISYAKNELYAKYGRKFESSELSEYMNSKTWYDGIYEPKEQDSYIVNQLMNDWERKNVAFLNSVESALGPYEYDKE